MGKPCNHPPRPDLKGVRLDRRTMCQDCWLYENSAKTRERWDGSRPPPRRGTGVEIPVPTEGVGTELGELISELGLKTGQGCGSCQALLDAMNIGGPRWVEENRDFILNQLRAAQARLRWSEKLTAALNAARGGLTLNPLDPASGLLDRASRRWEKKRGSAERSLPGPVRG